MNDRVEYCPYAPLARFALAEPGIAYDEFRCHAGCHDGLLAPEDAGGAPRVGGGLLGGRGCMGFDPGSGIVMREDVGDRLALACPDDGTPLTQPDAVAETLA